MSDEHVLLDNVASMARIIAGRDPCVLVSRAASHCGVTSKEFVDVAHDIGVLHRGVGAEAGSAVMTPKDAKRVVAALIVRTSGDTSRLHNAYRTMGVR